MTLSSALPRSPKEYYWGQQWTVRPNLSSGTPRRAGGHLSTLSNGGATAEVGKQEVPIQARPDWVKEWQARQATPTFLAAQKANDPDVTPVCAVIADAAGNASLIDDEGVTNWKRALPIFLPGFCGGAVLVCIAIFLVLRLAPSNSSSTPDVVPDWYAEKKSPTSDHVEPIARLKPERVSGAAAVIDDGGAPIDGAAEAKPVPFDTTSSLVPANTGAADEGELRRTSQSRVPAATDFLPDKTVNNSNPRPSSEPNTAPPSGLEGAAASDSATPDPQKNDAKEPAADIPVPRAEIVIKGAPTSGVVEPHSRPTRPAIVVSPQQSARVLGNTPPTDGLVSSQPNTDSGVALAKTTPRGAEPSVPSVTAPSGANGASAEPVRQRDVRDGLSTSIESAALLSRGDALFATGDIASARLFYEHAANAGNAQAAIRLGETFDPTFLSRVQVKGVRGEPAVALEWYKRAQELGASDADILVMSLERN